MGKIIGIAIEVIIPLVLLRLLMALYIRVQPKFKKFFREGGKEFIEDWSLFSRESAWDERIREWQEHVDNYATLKTTGKPQDPGMAALAAKALEEAQRKGGGSGTGAAAETPAPFGAARIDYLSSDRLAILDRKFSTLLQLQSILAVIVSIVINKFWDDVYRIATYRHGMWWIFIVPFLLWFITVVGCLVAVGNVRWGDLWSLGEPGHKQKTLPQLETTYVKVLVETVVARTAILRLLCAVALFNLVLCTFVFSTVLIFSPPPPRAKDQQVQQQQSGSQPPTSNGGDMASLPPPAPAPVSPAPSSFSFRTGQSCGNDVDRWVAQLADSLPKAPSRTGLAEASADITPLKPALRKLHGNDIGFAYARARCVAEKITAELTSRKVPVHMEVRVRDISDKSHPSQADRVVTVSWSH